MDIYTFQDLPYVWETLKKRIEQGEIGIFPTDTIYGITGNALDSEVTRRILRIKGRKMPFSFIPHSLQWTKLLIEEEQWEIFDDNINNFQGSFTTLWRYTNRWIDLPNPICSSGLIGVRFPHHWISQLVDQIKIPLTTTSVNIHRQPYMTCLDDLPKTIKNKIDFLVYEGPLYGPPSTIVHCYKDPFEYNERS